MTAPPVTATHPLDPLTADEITQAVAVTGVDGAAVISAFLAEPDKAEVGAFERGGPPPARRAVVIVYDGSTVHEVLVAGDRRLAARPVPGAVPPITQIEHEAAAAAVKA